MARPREFDETTAVEGAMNAFWAHGYEATSTQDLCEATGLGRSSIYNTFGSKRELFRRTLAHYTGQGLTTRSAVLETPGTAVDRIAALLDAVIDDELSHDRRGCLMVNTAAELGTPDDEIGALVKADSEAHLGLLTDCVRLGVLDGSIDPDRDPADVAEFVHGTVASLRLMSRRGARRKAMEAVADIAVSAVAAH